ncbi:MAG: hypothetical protein ABIG28_00735 [archaeon]
MNSEYVRLNGAERIYGQKHLLTAQLEFLNLIRSFRKYKRLRKYEMELKELLKNKIGDALVMVDKLENFLPKTHYMPEERVKKGKKDKKSLSIEEEINELKRKIEGLRGG